MHRAEGQRSLVLPFLQRTARIRGYLAGGAGPFQTRSQVAAVPDRERLPRLQAGVRFVLCQQRGAALYRPVIAGDQPQPAGPDHHSGRDAAQKHDLTLSYPADLGAQSGLGGAGLPLKDPCLANDRAGCG